MLRHARNIEMQFAGAVIHTWCHPDIGVST